MFRTTFSSFTRRSTPSLLNRSTTINKNIATANKNSSRILASNAAAAWNRLSSSTAAFGASNTTINDSKAGAAATGTGTISSSSSVSAAAAPPSQSSLRFTDDFVHRKAATTYFRDTDDTTLSRISGAFSTELCETSVIIAITPEKKNTAKKKAKPY